MNALEAARHLFSLNNLMQGLGSFQENVAEPFGRGVSPIPVEKLPLIGGNFHPALQNNTTRASTGLGLAAQMLLGGELLAPLRLAKGGLAAKTLGPNFARVADRALTAAKIGATTPVESSDWRSLLKDRKAGAIGGGILGGVGIVPSTISSKIPLNGGAGNNALGFGVQETFSPFNLARDIAAIGGGVGGYLGLRSNNGK